MKHLGPILTACLLSFGSPFAGEGLTDEEDGYLHLHGVKVYGGF